AVDVLGVAAGRRGLAYALRAGSARQSDAARADRTVDPGDAAFPRMGHADDADGAVRRARAVRDGGRGSPPGPRARDVPAHRARASRALGRRAAGARG